MRSFVEKDTESPRGHRGATTRAHEKQARGLSLSPARGGRMTPEETGNFSVGQRVFWHADGSDRVIIIAPDWRLDERGTTESAIATIVKI